MIKIVLISIGVYIGLVVLICAFFKGATQLGNRMDEIREAEEVLERLKKNDRGI